jgi:hypothetical protein
MLFERFEICPDLRASEYCLVLRQYRGGAFQRVAHEHAPKVRLSRDAAGEVLRALVSRFHEGEGMSAEQIVQSRLNTRGKPAAFSSLGFHVDYNEPGVQRTYCGGDTGGWFDVVIDREVFMRGREDTNAD